MKKNRVIAVLMSVVLLTSMAACGAPNAPKQEAQKEMENKEPDGMEAEKMETTKISFLTSQGKFKEEYRAMADAIKADHGFEVDFQVVPDNEFYSLLKVKLSTSEVPDVFEYNYPTQNQELSISQYCEDLSAEPWNERLINPDLIKDYVDGKIYALPKESASTYLAVYYNTKVLADCGLTDVNPKTYQEFIDILETVKQKGNGTIPFYMTCKDTWTTQIYPTCGFSVALDEKAPEIYDKLLTNKMGWNEVPEFESTLDDFKALFDKGYVNKDFLSATYDSATEKVASGKAAMYLSIESFAMNTKAQFPDVELGSFIIPYNDVYKLPIGQYVQGLFVPKEGKQVDKVKEFLRLWSDPKYQNIYYETQPGFPAFNDVNGGDVLPCVQKLVTDYVETNTYTYQLNDPMTAASTLFPDLWNYYNEMLSGTKTSAQVLGTFQKQYVDFMKQQGTAGF